MRVDVVDTPEGLAGLREEWERIFAADPEAQHFLSHGWISRYLAKRRRWFVLVLRPEEGTRAIALFPLRMQSRQDAEGRFFDEIIMAGNYAADYTGFIALPAAAEIAARAFAAWLRRQNWTQIKFDYLGGGEARTVALLRAMEGPGVKFRRNVPRNEQNIDNTICPYIALPDTFEAYLENHLSSQTRQKMRRFLRKLDGVAYSITRATPETIKRDLDILFDFWRTRWTPVKGEEKTEKLIVMSRRMLEDCFADGDLDVPVLWAGDRPLGALANILDRKKKLVLFYITGRDEEWKLPPPGLMLHGDAIRKAIAEGYRAYDFLRGNEPYKYAFGVEERRIACVLTKRETGRKGSIPLHPWSIRPVYEQALDFYHKGRKAEAEIAFSQVLEVQPAHGGATFGLANLQFEKRDFKKAENAYRALLQRGEPPVPILSRLGDLLIATRRLDEAVETYADICCVAPENTEARYKQGVAFLAAGEREKAAAAFSIAADNKSGLPEHAYHADKAKKALARLIFSQAKAPTPPVFPRDFHGLADGVRPVLH